MLQQQKTNIENAIMPFKVQQLIELIMQKKQLNFEDACNYLYTSDVYKLLLDEDAKLWYMSGLGIFEMIEDEKKAETYNANILLFFSFCLEKYKVFAHISAEETLFIFHKYRVFDYLCESFDVLHTQGENYIIEEIDEFIKIRQK